MARHAGPRPQTRTEIMKTSNAADESNVRQTVRMVMTVESIGSIIRTGQLFRVIWNKVRGGGVGDMLAILTEDLSGDTVVRDKAVRLGLLTVRRLDVEGEMTRTRQVRSFYAHDVREIRAGGVTYVSV